MTARPPTLLGMLKLQAVYVPPLVVEAVLGLVVLVVP